MHKTLKAFIGMMLCLFSIASLAAAPSNAEVEKYLQVSEMYGILDGMDEQIEGQLNQLMITVDAEVVEKIRLAMVGSWSETEGQAVIRDVLKEKMTSEELESLIQFHSQPWVQTISQAEDQSSSANFQSDMVRFFEDMQRQPPSESRTIAIREFVEKTKMTDVMINMITELSKSMFNAFSRINGSSSDEWVEVEQMFIQMKPQMEQQVTMMSFYLYRDISDNDLNAYGDFYAGDTGVKETKVILEGVNKAIASWAIALAADIDSIPDL